VTCLPRLEPPLFSVPFALAAFRFRSAQCLVHEPPLPPPYPHAAGFFMGHPLWPHQLLSAGKVAECRGLAGIDRCQQAQGKHGEECRGTQPKIVCWPDRSFYHPQPHSSQDRPVGRDEYRQHRSLGNRHARNGAHAVWYISRTAPRTAAQTITRRM